MPPPAGFLGRFKEQLVAEKKKSAILAILFAILLVAVVRLCLTGPAPAPAAPAVAVAVSTPSPAAPPLTRPIPQPIPAPRSPSAPRPAPRDGLRSADPHPDRPVVPVDNLPRDLKRDLFASPAWAAFPVDTAPDGDPSDRRRLREMRERIRAECEKLQLQSTMTGKLKSAYISGRLVCEGDTLDGFSVVRIGERHVTLRKAGITQTLSMP